MSWRRHPHGLVNVDIYSSSSSDNEPDDEWYNSNHEHHHNGHLQTHPRYGRGRSRSESRDSSHHKHHHHQHLVFPAPEVHSDSPHNRRSGEWPQSSARYDRGRRRGRSVDDHVSVGGPRLGMREDIHNTNNIWASGPRATLPNLKVDIHNHNSDHDFDHSHSHNHSHSPSPRRSTPAWPPWTQSVPVTVPVGNPFAPAPAPVQNNNPYYYTGPTRTQSGAAADGQAYVHDRFNADHRERMDQRVYVHNGEFEDPYHHHHHHDPYHDGLLRSSDIEHEKMVAVDRYKHHEYEAEEARRLAVRDAKLDLKEHDNEIDDAEGKAIAKYRARLDEQKKAQDEALFKFQQAEAKKAEELKLARDKWEVEQKKRAQEEEDRKKAWEAARLQEEQREEAKKREWETKQKQAEQKKKDEERAWTLKQQEAEKKRKDEERAWEQKKKEEEQKRKDDEKAAKEKWEQQQKEEEQKRKDDEKAAKEKWEANEKKKKEEAKKRDAEVEARIKVRLIDAGLGPSSAADVVDDSKNLPHIEPVHPRPTMTTRYETRIYHDRDRLPVRWEYFDPVEYDGRRYIRVHRQYVAPDTLRVYELPWEYDRTNPDYLIIRRPYDNPGLDLHILIEHTKHHHGEHRYLYTRSRSRSHHRAPTIVLTDPPKRRWSFQRPHSAGRWWS